MDLNAACSGFLYAINTSAQFLKTGACRHVLVIAAEIMSRKIDPRDSQTYPLFGDGAGAVLMDFERGDHHGAAPGILAQRLGACGELAHLIRMPLGSSSAAVVSEPRIDASQYIRLEGRSVFKWAATLAPAVVGAALEQAGLTVADIDLLIFHQANRRIMECAARTLNIHPEKVFVNIDRYGNTSSASIPLALDEATASGRIKAGHRIVLCGFGAGLTWGVCVYQVGHSPPAAGPHPGG
jgi:3-oxoacyl-[acyl-carrier-protein] synthase-3